MNQSPNGSVVSTAISTAIHHDDHTTASILELERDDAVPPLRLDDVQSAVSLDPDLTDAHESPPTVAFPRSTGPGSPRVTITIAPPQITEIVTANDATSRFSECLPLQDMSSSFHFPRPSGPGLSPAISEHDKLGELPTTTTSPRWPFGRSVPSQLLTRDVYISAQAVATTKTQSLRSGGSEPSLSAKSHGLRRVSFDGSGERRCFSSPIQLQHSRRGLTLGGTSSHSLPAVHTEEMHAPPRPQPSPPLLPTNRSPSPFRNFIRQRIQHREEPFQPVDPYRLKILPAAETLLYHFVSQLLLQLYRHFLLRLPSIYFTRVTRVFSDAELSRPEVQRWIEEGNRYDTYSAWPADHEWVIPIVSPAMIRFKESWETFIESVLKEWKTLNVLSALLLTAILAIFQIEGASQALIIRTTASLSLICALMSLIYGCVYILRFSSMKSMYRAFKWAQEAQQGTSILWNIWVLLAMPAVWISWSMLFFCISILNFVWNAPASDAGTAPKTDDSPPPPSPPPQQQQVVELVARVLVSVVFCLGVGYFVLVVRAFRSWRDPSVSELERENMGVGRWPTRSPSPGRDGVGVGVGVGGQSPKRLAVVTGSNGQSLRLDVVQSVESK